MKKIWEHNLEYDLIRPYVRWAVRTSFSKITVNGADDIPDAREVSVIFALNHCNTMMDSLVLFQSRKEPTSFVARADVFKKPSVARVLNSLKILPIYRTRDGERSQEKNVEVFNSIVDILNHGMAFSIHPEGTHRARRSLLPMKKGIFRIADQARRSNPDRPLVIVPVGLDYDDFFNIMCPVTISFGKPIPINGDEDMDKMAGLLYVKLSELFPFFPDDEHLNEAETAYNETHRPVFSIWHHLAAAALLPAFIASGLLCSPMILATAIIKTGIKDKAWLNTVRFSCKLALTPIMAAVATTVGFLTLSWPLATALIVATIYAHPIFYRILIFYKRLCLR